MVDLLEQIGNVKMLNPGLTVKGAFFTHWQNRETFFKAREALEESGICPVLQTAISYNPKCPRARLSICRCACSPGEVGQPSSTRN